MTNAYAYWGVIQPDFLKPGNFTTAKRDEARKWCLANCAGLFTSSDIHPWGFLVKGDAERFQARYGGTLAFKDES